MDAPAAHDLTASYHERQYRARTHRGKPAGRQAKDDLVKIQAEFQARRIPVPEPEKPRRRLRGEAGHDTPAR